MDQRLESNGPFVFARINVEVSSEACEAALANAGAIACSTALTIGAIDCVNSFVLTFATGVCASCARP